MTIQVAELLSGGVVLRQRWLRYCKVEYATKAAIRMKRVNKKRMLWLEKYDWPVRVIEMINR